MVNELASERATIFDNVFGNKQLAEHILICLCISEFFYNYKMYIHCDKCDTKVVQRIWYHQSSQCEVTPFYGNDQPAAASY